MVSQFEILPSYTQINYQGRPVRVTSLAYGDLIKWFTNRSDGLPAYLVIDMVTQEAEVVRLDEGMKYTHGGALRPEPGPPSAFPLSHHDVRRSGL